LGFAIAIMTSCNKNEESEGIISCTQVYYPTKNIITIHYSGFNPWERDDHTNYAGKSTALQSCIWTVWGMPCIGRFYINFDLSDYYHTQKTLISTIDLHLFAHPSFENHSSNTTNRHIFNRVIRNWEEPTLTWANQPEIDQTTQFITDHIPGTLDEPRRDNYLFNLNTILLEKGKLRTDYHGISCRPYQEHINDFYRRMTFASRDFGNEAFHPTLKVVYAFPQPTIKFENKVFSINNNEDLMVLFKNVQSVWTINGEEYAGESVHFESVAQQYNVYLRIIITNNIGEISEININSSF
jgi:hypothetical protein